MRQTVIEHLKLMNHQLIDFLIGFSLMNAMPHYVLGIWRARMLSGFGTGNRRNILWGLVNLLISLGLFLYQYGISGFAGHLIYTGALTLLVIFFLASPFWYWYYYWQNKQ